MPVLRYFAFYDAFEQVFLSIDDKCENGTESGILHEMQKKCPQTKFIPAPPNDSTCACNECNFMRLNTLEKLYNCLKDESPEIKVDAEIAEKAVKPIKRMLEISAKLGL